MKDIKTYILETQGEHDKSKVYDDLYADVEPYLNIWGAGPVYGWKGDKGICFQVTKGKGIDKNDWIIIAYNKQYDDLTIMLSPYGEGDPKTAKQIQNMVYAGQESIVINQMLGLK